MRRPEARSWLLAERTGTTANSQLCFPLSTSGAYFFTVSCPFGEAKAQHQSAHAQCSRPVKSFEFSQVGGCSHHSFLGSGLDFCVADKESKDSVNLALRTNGFLI